MRHLVLLGIAVICAGCIPEQPSSKETVAAYEIPFEKLSDRYELLNILDKTAEAQGGKTYANLYDEPIGGLGISIHVVSYDQGPNPQTLSTVIDLGHVGFPWIMLSRGRDENRARRFQKAALSRIKDRWPDTTPLPIINNRTIPNRNDLVKTKDGYKVKPSEVDKYHEESNL